jgi:aldehyde dehydrogenase (NAD+)
MSDFDASQIRRSWASDAGPSTAMLIDGDWVAAEDGRTFSCTDPFTGASWGSVPLAAPSDVDRAVRAAHRAFEEGPWRRMPAAQRAAVLRKLADLIEARSHDIALTEVRENGKLFSEMYHGALAFAGDARFFGTLAETVHGYTIDTPLAGFSAWTRREAIGVVAAITPWNTPLNLLGWKLFPALATGNSVVVKPSEVTPVSTLMIGEMACEAGLPAGVLNIVTGAGETGQALVAHPLVEKIAFTGSGTTGARIAAIAAERHARVSLELGGKSANIVFEDADVEAVLSAVASAFFSTAGQACNAGSRILVQRSIYDLFAERLATLARSIRLGDPLDPRSQMGPLSSRAQLAKVTSYFDRAREEQLQVIAGGARPDHSGFFVEPTIYADAQPDSRLLLEEIFGPVAVLVPFEDEAEAIRIANDSRFGLAAGVWTRDLTLAHRMIAAVRAGTVWVNTYRVGSHAIPFGGFKASGIGRETGIDALDAYTEVKSVWLKIVE